LSQSSLKNRSLLQPMDRARVVEIMGSRFGIPPEAFEGVSFSLRGRNVWAFSLPEIPDLAWETVGLRVISVRGRVPKPTTAALQLFGRHATKNVVDLGTEDALKFAAGERQRISAPVEDGYVVVSHGGDVLGCGQYLDGELISLLPKERRIGRAEPEEGRSGRGDL